MAGFVGASSGSYGATDHGYDDFPRRRLDRSMSALSAIFAAGSPGSLVRSVLLLANAGLGIIFGCIMVELAWDQTAYAYLDRHEGVEQLKWTIALLTLALEAQLVEYYVHAWRTKVDVLERCQELERRGVPESRRPLAPKPLAWWKLPVEMAVCAVIPLPDRALGLHERVMICLFLRLYLVLRLVHKIAPVYATRHELAAFSAMASAEGTKGSRFSREALSAAAVRRVRFGSALSLKTLFDEHPTSFVFLAFALIFFPASFAIYVQERDHQPEAFDLQGTLWFAIVTATTVGFGGIEVTDTVGRVISMVLCVSGVVILSLLVVAVTKNLEFSDDESLAWQLTKRLQHRPDLMRSAHAAAKAESAMRRGRSGRRKGAVAVLLGRASPGGARAGAGGPSALLGRDCAGPTAGRETRPRGSSSDEDGDEGTQAAPRTTAVRPLDPAGISMTDLSPGEAPARAVVTAPGAAPAAGGSDPDPMPDLRGIPTRLLMLFVAESVHKLAAAPGALDELRLRIEALERRPHHDAGDAIASEGSA